MVTLSSLKEIVTRIINVNDEGDDPWMGYQFFRHIKGVSMSIFSKVGLITDFGVTLTKIVDNLTKPKVAIVVVTIASLALVHQLAGDVICASMIDTIPFDKCIKTRNEGLLLILKELL